MSTGQKKKSGGQDQGQGGSKADDEVRQKRRQRRSQTETKLSFEFYLSEGNTYQNAGDFNRAITGYTKALDVRPDHKVCLLSRSECYLRLGDTQAAIVDANATVQDDPKFIRGVLQKANIYYQMGEFEYALVLYHRGHKLRPDIDSFRLGIQLCQEAVENSIGEKADVKLEKKGDLSFFAELQQSSKEQSDKRTTRETTSDKLNKQQSASTKTNTAKSSAKDDKTVKQLLEELYTDKKFLETILKDTEKAHNKTAQTEAVAQLSTGCLNYLDSRATFWQQKQPTYARRKASENTSKAAVRRTRDVVPWIIKSLEEAESAFSQEKYKNCLQKAMDVIKNLDGCSDTSDAEHVKLRCTAFSYVGNASYEMSDYEKALKYHRKEYNLAKMNNLYDALVRSLDSIGRTLIKQERYTEAIGVFKERQPMVTDSLESAWLHHELGRCHQRLEQFHEALEHGQQSFDAAVEVFDEIWQMNALILIAESHRCLKNLSSALDTFKQCLVLASANDDTEAVKAIQRSIDDLNKEITNNIERSSHHSSDQDQEDGVVQAVRQSSPSPRHQQQEEVAAAEGKDDGSNSLYTITVTISDVENAGTSVPVFIELIGDLGVTRVIQLDEYDNNADEHKFDRASENVFTIRALDVGKIRSLKLSQNSKVPGSGPHIARVHVQSAGSSKESYQFLCHQWLDKDLGDKLTARELRPVPTKNDKASYHVIVRTGADETAGTDAKVFLQIFGDIGETEPLLLDTTRSGTNTFRPSETNEFDLEAINVGQARKVRVEHKGSSSWLLEDVTVQLEGKLYKFSCSRWIEGDKQVELIAD